jgi:hypothetical protein
MMGYEELKKELQKVPITWIPALLIILAEQGYKRGTFLPGGVSQMLRKFEEREGHGNKT